MKAIFVYTNEDGHERGFVSESDARLSRGYGTDTKATPVREIPVFENYGEYADERDRGIRLEALAKLTTQEKKVLGLLFEEKPDEEAG